MGKIVQWRWYNILKSPQRMHVAIYMDGKMIVLRRILITLFCLLGALCILGVIYTFHSNNKEITFPIEGLVLPKSSTIVDFQTNNESEWTVKFNCRLPWPDVYSHFDSFLLRNSFSITPESFPPSNNGFSVLYESSQSDYSVFFLYAPTHLFSTIKNWKNENANYGLLIEKKP